MTTPIDVTILISCFNQEGFIGEAIDSALRQTHPVIVRVVDDGSTDRSVAVARSTGVEVVAHEHGGAFETFRVAVSTVTTPYFLLLAGDDRLPPHYVAETIGRMAPGVGIVYTPIRFFGAQAGFQRASQPWILRLRWANYIHGTSLVRTEAYHSVGGFDPAFAIAQEDWALWVAIISRGWRAVSAPSTWLEYRQHAIASRSTAGKPAVRRYRWMIARRNARAYGLGGFIILAAFEIAGVIRSVVRPVVSRLSMFRRKP